VAAYRAARRGLGQDRPSKEQVPEEARQVRHMRRDWFRNRVFHPAVEAAGLDWRPRVHDLRHASASWALAGGATVQQVREHLGHVSLRAVERYLHNLPGTDAGAAGAIARVRATGALYPLVTPSYTPVPLVSAPTVPAVPVPAPKQDADALSYTPPSPEQMSLDTCAAVSRREGSADTRGLDEPSLVSAGVVFAETVTAPSKPSGAEDLSVACSFAEPEAVHVEIVAANAAGEESVAQEVEPGLNGERIAVQKRSTPPRGRGRGRSRHRPNNKRRGGKGQNDHFRVQDRYTDDRQETDGRTTLRDTGSVPAETSATGRERYLEHLRLKSQATMLASGDTTTFAAESPRQTTAESSSSRQANQTSSAPEKCSRGSDPLTTDEQRIKKPVPSTRGDRL
jgi:hypothetical protein